MKKGGEEEAAKIGIFPHCRKKVCGRYMGVFRKLCKKKPLSIWNIAGFCLSLQHNKKEIVKEVQCRIAVLEDCFFLYFFFRASGMDTFLKQSSACEVSWVANGRASFDFFSGVLAKSLH